MANLLRVIVVIALWLPSICSSAERTPRVLFLNSLGTDTLFGAMQYQAITAAARDLDIKLSTIKTYQHQNLTADEITNLLSPAPDYLLVDYLAHTHHLLAAAEKLGIKTMILVDPSRVSISEKIGKSREKYKNWIGSIHNDNFWVGQKLTNILYQAASSQNILNQEDDGDTLTSLSLIAFNGQRTTHPAIERKRGLVDEADKLDIHIDAIYEIDWNATTATRPLLTAIKHYPQSTLFWAASDDISLEIMKKMKSIGKRPNVDFYTAGTDWTSRALDSVENGEMLASIGGQFLSFSWALVLIYDYHYGYDFGDYTLNMTSPMYVVDKNNVTTIKKFIDNKGWDTIDFKYYSRRHNKDFDGYNFDIMTVIHPQGNNIQQ